MQMQGLMEFIKNLDWVKIGVLALAIHTFLKAIRDAIDTTPDTDDNWFEKLVTDIGKIVAYLFGKRPN